MDRNIRMIGDLIYCACITGTLILATKELLRTKNHKIETIELPEEIEELKKQYEFDKKWEGYFNGK